MSKNEPLALNQQSSYLAVFYYLDKLYWSYQDKKSHEVDHLGDLLSAMNPFLFVDSQSADPAMAADWKKVYGNVNLTSVVEAFQNMIAFLELQQSWLDIQFPLHLLQLVTIDDSKDKSWQQWLECVNEAISQSEKGLR